MQGVTTTENSLRRQIAALTAALARRPTPGPPRPRKQRCVYCGAPSSRRVCHAHSDLEDAA